VLRAVGRACFGIVVNDIVEQQKVRHGGSITGT
jgi:hypothetical protein